MSFQAGSPSHDLKGLGSDRSIEVLPWGTKEKGVGGNTRDDKLDEMGEVQERFKGRRG